MKISLVGGGVMLFMLLIVGFLYILVTSNQQRHTDIMDITSPKRRNVHHPQNQKYNKPRFSINTASPYTLNKRIKNIYLRYFLASPPPYKYKKFTDQTFSQAHQDKKVYEIFGKKSGFFIEMGAYDGRTFSNTLWLERQHNWTGLLIEPDPVQCRRIDGIGRQAWRLCGCIARTMQNVSFILANMVGGVKDHLILQHLKVLGRRRPIKVPCFRLITVLEEINIKHIDYFSLDVEGAEMAVLNSIKKELISGAVTVDIWTIEYRVWPYNTLSLTLQNLSNLRNFFKEIGSYSEHSKTAENNETSDKKGLDVIFVNNKRWCKDVSILPDGNKC